jgi:quercetin dioxygenase-like cupin family protein
MKEKRMDIVPPSGSTKGPDNMFTGDVFFDVITGGEELPHTRVSSVHFTPGARTAWHKHAVGQVLHVTEGVGLVQARGGEVKVIRPGDNVHIPGGEWHWHGATRNNFMTHIAIWETPESGPDSEWADHVTDEEYNRQS